MSSSIATKKESKDEIPLKPEKKIKMKKKEFNRV